MTRKSVVVYANDENIGDFLSAQGIALLADRNTRLFPFERRMPALRAMLSRLDPGATVIVGGGGLLKDSFDRFWRVILEAHARSKFRLVLWGVGYCDVVGEDTRGALCLAREVVRSSAGSAFRDDLSYEPFADLSGTRVIGCPALHALRFLDPPLISGSAPRRLLRVDHPDLLAGISRRRNVDAAARFSLVCQEWAEERDYEVDATSNMIDRVGKVPDSVRARMGVTPLETRAAKRRAFALLSRHYAPADIVVTSRLHGAIIAAGLGKRVVALSNDAKIDQFMSSIGLGRFVTRDVEEVPELLNSIEWQPCITERVATLRAQNEAFASDLGYATEPE